MNVAIALSKQAFSPRAISLSHSSGQLDMVPLFHYDCSLDSAVAQSITDRARRRLAAALVSSDSAVLQI